MGSAEHPALVQVVGHSDTRIFDLARLDRICDEMPRPAQQFPRIVTLVGRRRRDAALRHIFPRNNIGRRPQSCINLRLDLSTSDHENPVLFLDSDPATCTDESPPSEFAPSTAYPVSWMKREVTAEMTTDILHSRFVFLFSDVVCVFMEDFQTLEDVWTRIRHWVQIGSASTFEPALRPRLLLVKSKVPLQEIPYHLLGGKSHFFDCFSAVRMFEDPAKQTSKYTRTIRLRQCLLREADALQEIRRSRHASFSTTQINVLIRRAIEHWASNIRDPFDFLEAAHFPNAAPDISHHLIRFLRLCQQSKVPYPEIIYFLATAFVSNAYPPEMRSAPNETVLFDPRWVFHARYYDSCSVASQSLDVVIHTSFCSDIRETFAALVQPSTESSLQLRQNYLRGTSSRWSSMKDNNTCLACVERAPEHQLSCGHAICDTCVLRYGWVCQGTEYLFRLDACILCQAKTETRIRIKPPTAGIRILSIDGGGTRGAVPLESLCLLQDLLSDLPLQECFELALGTSSGGLIILGLYALAWDPHSCSHAFDKLSREIFGNKKSEKSFAVSVKRFVRCWVADSVHDAEAFEALLQQMFGMEARLFGSPANELAGAKFGVVTSSISDATPFLLTNYNGRAVKHRVATPIAVGDLSPYELLRPENERDEPRIWEAARATSAAPLLYRTCRIGKLGSFQDGALKHNNPSKLACWESKRLWPSIKSPDVLLNLGTGTPSSTKGQSHPPHFRHFLVDGFIPRLLRSGITKTDGEKMWGDLMNSVDERSRASFYRLNIPLAGAALLDDVDGMDDLRETVRSHPNGSVTRLEVAKALMTSCFFFQLEGLPKWTSSGYQVQGSIRCRSDTRRVLNVMSRLGVDAVEFTTEREVLRNLSDVHDDVCAKCERYKRDVRFYVRHPSDLVCIFMKSPTLPRSKLSGFPQSIDWFVREQGLDKAFGTSDHGIPGRLRCTLCSAERKKALDLEEKGSQWSHRNKRVRRA